MTGSDPFDTSHPSPIGRLLQLRAGASEAVVREGHLSGVQALMARPGVLEARLWNALGEDPPLRLLVLTGSAGSGKSATLNHLLARQQEEGGGRIGECLADATHSDAPDQGQAERLARFFAPFSDGAAEPAGGCRIVAMNTGMALRFFNDLPDVPEAPALSQLESLLRSRLGLPTLPGASDPAGWMRSGILVVNLDHRTTVGSDGALLEEILARFDPADPSGVLEGTPRCNTCKVRDWCWPMANAHVISAEPGRRAINRAAGDLALARGRQLAPRSLWDAAAELALGGLPAADRDGRDPCYAIVDIAEEADEAVLLHAMACNGALGPVHLETSWLRPAAEGSLIAELATREPSYSVTFPVHKLIADAGLDPDSDADQLRRFLRGSLDMPHPAVERAASALEGGKGASADGARVWGRMMARAAWLGGDLAGGTGISSEFMAALAAQHEGEDETTAGGDALENALGVIEEGLARVFGLVAGPEHYYPTSTLQASATADLMVLVRLVETHALHSRRDPVLAANRAGAEIVDYQPLALSLEIDKKPVAVDYPLWQLLSEAATGGVIPTTIDLERFLALRRAIRAVGVRVAASGDQPLLVRERSPEERRFRIVKRNTATDLLRAREIL